MNETKIICNLKFSINNRLIVYTKSELINEDDKTITFIDSFTNKTITYSKNFFVSKEVV